MKASVTSQIYELGNSFMGRIIIYVKSDLGCNVYIYRSTCIIINL